MIKMPVFTTHESAGYNNDRAIRRRIRARRKKDLARKIDKERCNCYVAEMDSCRALTHMYCKYEGRCAFYKEIEEGGYEDEAAEEGD